MSKGSDLITLGKITTLFDTIDSVLPSGMARARACRPTTPPAPGWLSTTTDALSAFDSAGCAARVIASTPEPVALGRMKRTVPDCASAASGHAPAAMAAIEAASAERREKFCLVVMVCLLRSSDCGAMPPHASNVVARRS